MLGAFGVLILLSLKVWVCFAVQIDPFRVASWSFRGHDSRPRFVLRSVGIDADCKAHLFPSGVEECKEVHAGFTRETVVNAGMDRPHAIAAAMIL